MAKRKPALSKSKKTAAKKTSQKKMNVSKEAASLVLGDGVWPLERDVLFRPDRLKYVRKLIKVEGCVFCHASKEISFDSLCVYQTKHSMVVLNKFPYNSGHILVLPRRHNGNLNGLTVEEWSDLSNLLRLAMKVVETVYGPAGFNMGLNQGAVAGAGIPEHLHFHLIPRWAGDLNFFPLIAETKVVIETLDTTYARLSEAFQGQGN